MEQSSNRPKKISGPNAEAPGERGAMPSHLSCLKKRSVGLATSDGQPIDVWELSVPADAEVLSNWARHFRQRYCSDSEIDRLRAGTGLTRAEYLTQLVFPDSSTPPGPSIRAGDFAELLVSDYLEYHLSYWVPRGKYSEKATRNESIHGVDLIGFRAASPPADSDTLITFEVKAKLTGDAYANTLQDAVRDSPKDLIRRAMTLNATKRRLINAGDAEKALLVERFQNPVDRPYVYKTGAAAVVSDSSFDEGKIQKSTTVKGHPNFDNIQLLVVKGANMMALVRSLYDRAAHEA